jgi:sialidase-1
MDNDEQVWFPMNLTIWIATVALAGRLPGSEPMMSQVDIAKGGEGGYLHYRIPNLLTTRRTVIAVLEGRKTSLSDSSDIDTLAMRSFDSGKTWTRYQVIGDNGVDKIGNPCTLLDRTTGTVWVFLTVYQATLSQKQIIAGEGSIRIWTTKSTDDGAHWSTPVDISSQIKGKDERQTWFSTGPGTGIQLRNGRLVAPMYYRWKGSDVSYSVAMYSDDHGKTWTLGKPAGDHTNEAQLVELSDGSLVYNMRSYLGKNRRAISHSRDGGETWTAPELDLALIEPVCQASFVAWTKKGKPYRDWLLFSNPADTKRDNMTVRVSYDGGKVWAASRALYPGPSGYSSLAVLPDGVIGCLYERGDAGPYEKLTFARFNLEWLTGADQPKR